MTLAKYDAAARRVPRSADAPTRAKRDVGIAASGPAPTEAALNQDPSAPPAPLGAIWKKGQGTQFCVWAPRPRHLGLVVRHAGAERTIALERDGFGYATVTLPDVGPGARYGFRLHDTAGNSALRPDPASRLQPHGVHELSEVIDIGAFAYRRRPAAPPLALADYVFYELHVAAFTRTSAGAGTFHSAMAELARLRALGVTAVELMPVAQFPGTRNWGYDGVYPFAAQASYGGPAGLAALVDACHARGLAVVLDVVYNHLGPEGNYLAEFGPYFTEKYHTPWGAALNFDGADSGPVRAYFIASALYWLSEIGFDALRLDAIHGIFDRSAQPFLADLTAAVDAAARTGRRHYIIAESDLNDVRVLRPRDQGGLGMDAQWSDDLHHSLHCLLTPERTGYYADFGRASDLARALRDSFVYAGQYSSYRRRRHGNSARGFERSRFVVCAQNHDQVGNRAQGDRLAAHLDAAALRLAAAVVLLAPNLPLLFMGEEYAETAPFPYFIDHGDPALVEAVRRGRAAEFAAFAWQGVLPDPAAPATFASAQLDPQRRRSPAGRAMESWYRRLLALRRDWLATLPDAIEVSSREQPPLVEWRRGDAAALFYFGREPWTGSLAWPRGEWRRVLQSGGDEALPLPATLHSLGTVAVTLPPWAVAIYRRARKVTAHRPTRARRAAAGGVPSRSRKR